jgi:hypothetical protein
VWNVRPRTSQAIAILALVAVASRGVRAADLVGRVTFGEFPVPGATVTATCGDQSRITVTDTQGTYQLTDLADGEWIVQVEMLGFSPLRQTVQVAPGAPPASFALAILPFDTIAASAAQRGESASTAAPTSDALPAAAAPTGQAPSSPTTPGFQRAEVKAPAASPAPAPAAIVGGSGDADRSGDAADGFLINGSVNNSASSPFAQLAAFGNNRRGARSLYNGGIGVMLGNSAWAAAPYSFTSQPSPKPDYTDTQVVGSFSGPVKIPGLHNKANVFLGFQHTDDNSATTQSTLMPTDAERHGDFSQSINAFGQPVRPIDPATGAAFPNNRIPQDRISSQAAALLGYYPLPNADGGSQYNFEAPVLLSTRQDAIQARVIESVNSKNQVYGNVSIQRTRTNIGSVFALVDKNVVSGIDAPINWSHRFSQFYSLRLRYQFTRLATDATPHFSDRTNVSGLAGISGNNQDPANWGPPALVFASGIAGLATAQFASNRDRTHAWGAESQWNHGRHNVTFGGDVKRRRLDIVSQLNARGTFDFTGRSTGSDLADFLLGLPHASALATGNADKLLAATNADAYVTDDWRVSPTLTANVGVRWEYEAPFTERHGRLVNLDIAPGFSAAAPVVASNPIGSVTGERYPNSLIRLDARGLQPRIGVAWRPVPGSSLVVRGGYGVYRNAAVYQAMTLLLAQQPPLSNASSVESTSEHPLTLANGFIPPTPGALGTFAVDPNLRAGYAHNWQVLVQRDLPASLTITTTYLGSAGRRLLQESLPNTNPVGAVNACPSCPSGFVYLTSGGSANRHAGQVLLRRRLRAGLAASVQYTLATASDDAAAAFTGATLNGAAIVQDWRNVAAEQAPSSFDQRHLVNAQVQYTSGVGLNGGALTDGVRGSLLKGWTVTTQLSTGSGVPLTPVILGTVPGTAVTGSIRPSYHAAADQDLAGAYANPAAYAAPGSGSWGNAGRNSIRGPSQFSMNASLGRSFLWGPRLTADWRLDVVNLLNHVTFISVNTAFGSPQFGLPNQASVMRKLQTTLRVRF